ncbi:MAG: LON peptidase substrate-binding domain-containing protein [Geminicoccaceae bacterium]|nr:LON peptidase substrate-binding domain-containing protein [Geminicoccaceae bacterium]
MRNPIASLPERFPVFPLRGTVLLPRGSLPLNIFEPRYLAMVRDAMQTDQVIGMIQPRVSESEQNPPPLYEIGCAGRVSNFQETDDGRFLITLTGICRFDVVGELTVDTPYRQIQAGFSRWHGDLEPDTPPDIMRVELLEALHGYFEQHDIEADWKAIQNAPLSGLITSLAMICPFETTEKQALLEADTLERQARLLVALMQMAIAESSQGSPVIH